MPGANYMGGRRNVMKARAKDAVGRQQKGHFGRQRLDILSKGISATKPSEMGRTDLMLPAVGKSSAQDIDLAHARKKICLENTTASVRSFIPSPIHVTPWSPRSHRKVRMRASETHIPSPDARRSKVLDAVDLSETLFLRRIADQILAMPSLACLPDRNSSRTASTSRVSEKKKLANKSISTPMRSEKRKMLAVDDPEESDPRRKLYIKDKSVFRGYATRNSQDPHTPPRKKQKCSKSSSSNTSSQPSHYQINNYFSSPFSSLVKDDRYHHSTEDSGFDGSDLDSEVFDTIIQSSSLWSPEDRGHSSRTSIDDNDDFQQNLISFFTDDDTSQVSKNTSSSCLEEDINRVFVQQVFEQESDYLPSAIVLGPSTQQQIGNSNSQHYITEIKTSYGSLFEKEDPWRTIGMILGLPETENKRDSANLPNVDRKATTSDNDQDQQWDSPFQKEIEVVAEKVQFEKGESDDNETEDDETFQMGYEWQVQSPSMSAFKQVVGDGLHIQGNFKVAELPFHDIVDNLDCTSSMQDSDGTIMDINRLASQEMKGLILKVWNNSDDQDINDVVKTPTVFQHCDAPEETPQLTVPDSDGEYVMSVDDADGGSGAGDKILSTPELREVDGRFLGPCLFEGCDESDEE